MYEKINKCPVCNSEDIKNLMICKDHLVSGESFAINECRQCTFRFTNPRPADAQLNTYYQSKEYISHTNKAYSLQHLLYKIVRHYTLQRKLKLIRSLSKTGKILDLGCGTGDFLNLCSKNGWDIEGVEMDQKAREKSEKLLNVKIHERLFSVEKENSFQIITLWHVLEHLPDLNKTITHLMKLLTVRGRLVIALPNVDSYDAKKYGNFWAGYDVPRHLYHFNQPTFQRLMRKHNLKIERVIPMRFDAFYVSLLSEKYQNKYFNYIRSFVTGCISNSYGRNNNLNYSSLIYIVKK